MVIFLLLALFFLHEIEAKNFLVELNGAAEDHGYEIATEETMETGVATGDDYGIDQKWAVIWTGRKQIVHIS